MVSDEYLKNFIDENKKKGFNDEKIKNHLINNGVSEDRFKKYFLDKIKPIEEKIEKIKDDVKPKNKKIIPLIIFLILIILGLIFLLIFFLVDDKNNNEIEVEDDKSFFEKILIEEDEEKNILPPSLPE